ncbi:hypothetical protein MKEN_01221300 [Mycena kentingensis (nom. inval.)]|nr:hypothetical protein MKEN_01221300 [Mycena kentingensis (nom. inval.)]
MASGTVICNDLLSASVTFPKSRAVAQAIIATLKNDISTEKAVEIVLNSIWIHLRQQNTPGLPAKFDSQAIDALYDHPPTIKVVEGLATQDKGRVWTCVLQDTENIVRFGGKQGEDVICIAGFVVRTIEQTKSESVRIFASLLLIASITHEMMHLIRSRAFFGIASEDKPEPESGWHLEQILFGGIIGVVWKPEDVFLELEKVVWFVLHANGKSFKIDFAAARLVVESVIQDHRWREVEVSQTQTVHFPPLVESRAPASAQDSADVAPRSVESFGLKICFLEDK